MITERSKREVKIFPSNKFALPWESEHDHMDSYSLSFFDDSRLGWKGHPSGCSFKLILHYKFVTYYFSGRDRAGREKEKDNKWDKTPMNHICRDWISGFPLVKAGGWKRLFRRVYPNQEMVEELFGAKLEEAEEVEDLREPNRDEPNKGALKFHHSIIEEMQVGRYKITPRKEASGSADVLIVFEAVAPGTYCGFVVDYIPHEVDFDRSKTVCLDLLSAAVNAEDDAIGGKTSSGTFGKVQLIEALIWAGTELGLGESDLDDLRRKGIKVVILTTLGGK